MTDKAKIRKETEKCYSDALERAKIFNTDYWEGKADAYRNVLIQLDSLQEEPVNNDLGEYINELSKQFPEVSFAKLSRIAVRVAKWQKANLWKPADGDLPEIDKEVIVLVGIKNHVTTDSLWGCDVAFAHRPNPDGWDGKSITTGEVEHYEAQTYGKGGWNIPDVKFWLDCALPKMEGGEV